MNTSSHDSPMPPDCDYCLVVCAAGTGQRMGAQCKKPYLLLDDEPILFHTLRRLCECRGCRQIVLVLHQDEADDLPSGWERRLRDEFGVDRITAGGATRQESAWRGIKLASESVDVVMTHDGVRPFVHTEVVEKVAREAAEHGAALAAIPATATVKEVSRSGVVKRTHPREDIWLAQTPQGFRRDLLMEAYQKALDAGFVGTDDAQILEWAGHEVRIVRDSKDNIKITTPHDIQVAESILSRQRKDCPQDFSDRIPRLIDRP
mgnify:CR=1 FL=1